jgi:hypothetical protein
MRIATEKSSEYAGEPVVSPPVCTIFPLKTASLYLSFFLKHNESGTEFTMVDMSYDAEGPNAIG